MPRASRRVVNPSSSPPPVAVVTINFGPPDDTFECVQSVLATGYPALRMIVVDNGSAPEHRERLKRSLPAEVELIESPANLGFSGGNNLGIRRALDAGDRYVVLLNNDATIEPDALRIMVESAAATSRLGVLSGKVFISGDGDTGGARRIWSAGGWWSPLRATGVTRGMGEVDRGQYDAPSDQGFMPACFWLVPAEIFRNQGLLPEEFFLYGEDLEYCLELRRAGYRIRYEPKAVCHHKVSRSNWKDRDRASPILNYYTNRNRITAARKWVSFPVRAVFYVYLFSSRLFLAITRRDLSFLSGLADGVRGVTGPKPVRRKT